MLLTLLLLTSGVFLSAENLELPLCDASEITDHGWYKLKYNEVTEQPDWAAYELTREELTGSYPRKDSFRADPSIETGSAELSDYRGSGYDRGHLVPAGDLKISAEAMSASFYLSNMSPQAPAFNRGIWLDLENYVRTWAWEYGNIYIITGPVFTGSKQTIGENEVGVPDYFFKAVLVYNDDLRQAAAFILPNAGTEKSVSDFIYTIDEAERLTGLDLFYALPDSVEQQIEADVSAVDWIWEEFSFLERDKKLQDAEPVYKYWINSSTGTRHNPSCEYYGNTKEGYYTNKKIGKACGKCGG